MRFFVSFFRLGALALLFGTLLSACVVEEVPGPGPGPRPLPPERPQFCTREYDPVCARRGNDRQTFPNACQAEAQGYRVIRGGECRGGAGGGEQPRFCTREYAPVCARRGGERQTFSNSCEAENAGFRVISGGECRSSGGGVGGGGEPRFCTREYAPVCGRRGGEHQTFPNSCEADNAGYRVVADGPC
jgi:hypothetical protein